MLTAEATLLDITSSAPPSRPDIIAYGNENQDGSCRNTKPDASNNKYLNIWWKWNHISQHKNWAQIGIFSKKASLRSIFKQRMSNIVCFLLLKCQLLLFLVVYDSNRGFFVFWTVGRTTEVLWRRHFWLREIVLNIFLYSFDIFKALTVEIITVSSTLSSRHRLSWQRKNKMAAAQRFKTVVHKSTVEKRFTTELFPLLLSAQLSNKSKIKIYVNMMTFMSVSVHEVQNTTAQLHNADDVYNLILFSGTTL